MTRNPYLIVKEFVDSPSEQARRNAITALAVLADPEALTDLVRLALNDAVPAVRERAGQEIAGLPPEKLRAVLGTLHERIRARSDDQYRAYAALGRLQSLGVRAGPPRVSLLDRIRLAKRAPEDAQLGRRSAVLRSLWASLRGGIGGSIVFMLLIGGVFSLAVKTSDTVGYSIVSVLVGVLVAMCAVSLSVPLGVQADPLAAVVIDFGMLLVVSVSASFLSSLLLTGADRQPPALWCVYLMSTLSAIAIRAAMLLAMGSCRSRTANLWIGISSGTAAGVVVVSVLPAWLGRATNGSIASVWVGAVPVVAAVATAFAVVDSQARTPQLVPGPLRVAGFLPLILLVAAIVRISLVSPHANATASAPVVDAGEGVAGKSYGVELKAVPASINFSTRQKETVEVFLACRDPTASFTVYNAAGIVEHTGSERAPLPFALNAGNHHGVVSSGLLSLSMNLNMEEVLPTLVETLLHGKPNPPPPSCTVQLTFNVAKP